jgi:hypothetical protein
VSVQLDGDADANESSSSEYPGLPKSTIVVAGLAIALAGMMTFAILKWSDSRTAATGLRAEIAEVDAQLAGLRPELTGVEGQLGGLEQRTELLERGRMTICNYSGDQVTVKVVAATWLGVDGKFTTFNSAETGLDLWKIPAGERVLIDHPQSGWDGSATYYSLWLRVRGQEYPYAGTWPAGSDDCTITWT